MVIAVWRKAWPARLVVGSVSLCNTLPPEIALCGASPNHDAKCLTVGHLLISVPISDRIVWTKAALRPSTIVRSTPVSRIAAVWTSTAGECRCRRLGLEGGTGSAGIQRGFIAENWR